MWLVYVAVVVVLVFGAYAFAKVAGFQTRTLTRRTTRTAEDLYDAYADPPARNPDDHERPERRDQS